MKRLVKRYKDIQNLLKKYIRTPIKEISPYTRKLNSYLNSLYKNRYYKTSSFRSNLMSFKSYKNEC
jgi:hypothetical protein